MATGMQAHENCGVVFISAASLSECTRASCLVSFETPMNGCSHPNNENRSGARAPRIRVSLWALQGDITNEFFCNLSCHHETATNHHFFYKGTFTSAYLYETAMSVYIFGCCWVAQWKVPNPSTIARALIPITFLPGKISCRICSAAASFGSLNTGTITTVFPI